MRRKVLSVDSAADGYEAGKLILQEQGGYVLVENNDTVIGIITCRHFVEEILKWKAAPSDMRVRHIMSTPVHMIESAKNLGRSAAKQAELLGRFVASPLKGVCADIDLFLGR